jgi:hypothetical protein
MSQKSLTLQTVAVGTYLRPFEKLSPACVLDQHTVRDCNRTILRVDLTRIRDDSTHMRVQNLYF